MAGSHLSENQEESLSRTKEEKTEVSGGEESTNVDDNLEVDRRNRLLHSHPISFSSGNHFVEVTKGLLHLYKEK